ncbi:basic proline-rich protein-like [Orcinus orca]|uniref:basic proline-rich protein-like n=1 Tax=Orcinus orca TaxID=9733 RepID=UPI0021126CED|nr:basic proline-rich protein-like [Orcinus orca]
MKPIRKPERTGTEQTRPSRPVPAQNESRGPTEPPACHFPPQNPACAGLRPDPLRRPPPPLRPRLPPSPRSPTHGLRGSSGSGGRLGPSLRAQSPEAPWTATYSPDIRNTPSPGTSGRVLAPAPSQRHVALTPGAALPATGTAEGRASGETKTLGGGPDLAPPPPVGSAGTARRGSAVPRRVGASSWSLAGDLDGFKSDRVRSQTLGENQKWRPADKKTESNVKMNDAFGWEDYHKDLNFLLFPLTGYETNTPFT